MSFEISHPTQFVSQPEFAMEFAHSKQQQISSSPYNNDTIDKSSIGTQDFYVDFDHPSTHSSSRHHDASSVIPAPNSLVAAQTPPNQFEPYSTDLDLSICSLSSAQPSRKKNHRPCLEQLSPLPMYESQVIQSSETDINASMARITDMIHSQQQMIWKQDLCSPLLATTNTSWTQPQQQDAFGLSTATTTVPRSLSDSPSLRYRNSNDPPCNCIPMMQYDPIYNHSETLSVPYYGLPATSTSPPSPFTAIHSDLAKNNTKTMGYCHGSQHRLSMDQFYQHSYLDLSPSSSSSLSDDYSQQHHSMNNNLDNHIGTNPITSTSTSSSNTGSATTTTSTPRRYKCTVCVKRFTRPSSLATHMHSHTGEKPYKCNVDGCGRRFSVVSNLRRHAKIHLHGASMSGRKLQLV